MAGPELTLIACAAPLSERMPEVAAAVRAAGWNVTAVATPSAIGWLDPAAVRRAVGSQLLVEYRQPSTPKRGRPDCVVVCPLTFNSLNKMAAGISDNYATGLLNEAVAAGIPVIAVPLISDRLWPHPALAGHVDLLERAGVTFVDARSGRPGARPVASGTGAEVAAAFDPAWLVAQLQGVRAA